MNAVKCAYGLIGEKLAHSFSPSIHKKLGISYYDIIETPREKLEKVLRDEHYKGFNVTIPYKRDVMEYCDYISEEARQIGSVNTVVRLENGRLSAYNTDIDGFVYCALLAGIDFKGKKVLICGSGGTSLTAQAAAKKLGASRITVASRKGEIDYSRLSDFSDTNILVNTTPVGMYPNNLDSPVNTDDFSTLSGVIDVIYNPRRTALLMEAEKRGIPCTDGLPMLVYQAKRAEELFLDKTIPDSEAARVTYELRAESGNIVLIGMPGSGKSVVAENISLNMGRVFVNIDTEIEKTAGKTIPEIFAEDGESAFREFERIETAKAGKMTGIVIATGGGVVKDIRNLKTLRQNGRIYYLRRDIDKLTTEGRPLSKSKEELLKLQSEREPLYSKFADAEIKNDALPQDAARKIMEEYYENIGH